MALTDQLRPTRGEGGGLASRSDLEASHTPPAQAVLLLIAYFSTGERVYPAAWRNLR